MPETTVKKMEHCMFSTSDIEINRHPVFLFCQVKYQFVIFRVNKTKVIPARSCPLWHCVGFSSSPAAVFVSNIQPLIRIRKWRFARFARKIFFKFRKLKRKLIVAKQG